MAALRLSHHSQAALDRDAVVQRPLRSRLDHRPVGQGIGEGQTQLEQIRAGRGQRLDDPGRLLQRGVAEHLVGHEGRATLGLGLGEGGADAFDAGVVQWGLLW